MDTSIEILAIFEALFETKIKTVEATCRIFLKWKEMKPYLTILPENGLSILRVVTCSLR